MDKPGENTAGSAETALYTAFCTYRMQELEDRLLAAPTREEKAFWRTLLDLKLQMEQEKVIGEVLL